MVDALAYSLASSVGTGMILLRSRADQPAAAGDERALAVAVRRRALPEPRHDAGFLRKSADPYRATSIRAGGRRPATGRSWRA